MILQDFTEFDLNQLDLPLFISYYYYQIEGKSSAEKRSTLDDDDVQCKVCREIMTSAVLLPCCAVAACNICAQKYLTENEHVCPLCKEANQSLEDKIPTIGVTFKVAKLGEQVLLISRLLN